jgi:hypothetical protein
MTVANDVWTLEGIGAEMVLMSTKGFHTVSPLEIPPVILPETAGRASMASDAKTGG